jgi:hypothetical protein
MTYQRKFVLISYATIALCVLEIIARMVLL